MKKLILLSSIIVSSLLQGNSQVIVLNLDHNLKNVPESTVYAVLTGNKQVDSVLKESIKYWTFSKIALIDSNMHKELKSVESNYFLILLFYKEKKGSYPDDYKLKDKLDDDLGSEIRLRREVRQNGKTKKPLLSVPVILFLTLHMLSPKFPY